MSCYIYVGIDRRWDIGKEREMNWFTADLHLSHEKIMEYCKRPFSTIKEMDATILQYFGKHFTKGDILYMLGDISFQEEIAEWFLKEVISWGVQVHYVWGNHDKGSKLKRAIEKSCVWTGDLKHIKIENEKMTLSHYCMRTWKGSHKGTWNLYGHSHGDLEDIGLQYDVGVDNNNYCPISFREIKRLMDSRPQTFIDHHIRNNK